MKYFDHLPQVINYCWYGGSGKNVGRTCRKAESGEGKEDLNSARCLRVNSLCEFCKDEFCRNEFHRYVKIRYVNIKKVRDRDQ